MAKRVTRTKYQYDYYHAVRGPKTAVLNKIKRQTCQVCGRSLGRRVRVGGLEPS